MAADGLAKVKEKNHIIILILRVVWGTSDAFVPVR